MGSYKDKQFNRTTYRSGVCNGKRNDEKHLKTQGTK